MKRIRIEAGKVGLAFSQGTYKRVLDEGGHWIGTGECIKRFDTAQRFYPRKELGDELEHYLSDERLARMLIVFEVKQRELMIHYEDGIFQSVLTPGKYAFWKGRNYTFIRADLGKVEITEGLSTLTLKRKELAPYVCSLQVKPRERAVLLVGNQVARILIPGEYFFWKSQGQTEILKIKEADNLGQMVMVQGKKNANPVNCQNNVGKP